MKRLGIDVGGTNTDAVLLDEQSRVIASVKTHTTVDIQTGINNAINDVLKKSKVDPKTIKQAMLGTTQCTNAIVERKGLAKVGVIRLGYPATTSVEPYAEWPIDIVNELSGKFKIVKGGYEFDGQELTQLDFEELKETLLSWKGHIESIAIIGVFSAINNEQEEKVAIFVKKVLGNKIPISLSAKVGSLGLITRENATILNSALFNVIHKVSTGFTKALEKQAITDAAIFLCQNDGTLMSTKYAEKYPILTIGSGPTNSIRGAAYLAKKKNALVLDIGGTTSDIGVLSNGFPRESSIAETVGGVKTNFRMPDILSIGLGGGSIVRQQADGTVTVGPDSVGYKIEEKAIVFGGNIITTTDIAVKLGMVEVGNVNLVDKIDIKFAQQAFIVIQDMLTDALDKMKTSSQQVELILVGGGAIIAPKQISGISNIWRSNYGSVANAIGATIAQVSGEFEKIYQYDIIKRAQALEDSKSKAIKQALEAGAEDKSIKVVEIEEIPLAYAPNDTTRVKVKVVGEIK
ncbi:hydantoinase/oxoprolinase family protein [Ligilactobacillus sp. WILCCON 0076]|uniref:Hydantoinase/oxoprolinase family protein n=1 Tax=Ligilactobacillus ubinensis TaxID=2876789 RepID=A0A9X2JLL2_9LACO|nr:hydantoinase/oxoprolinase family protein [Ligilactobacillus ubinensis]MCP0887098.1 hydantoinase/oxoprolinase family protein [Ligilactobacillus ubinensis]